MTSNLVQILVQVFNDLLSYLQIEHKFMGEVSESSMDLVDPVNILIDITGNMEGNIILYYTNATAKEIAAKLIGVENLEELDIYAQAALVDFCGEFSKRVLNLIKQEQALLASNPNAVGDKKKEYNLVASYPRYATGEEMQGVINKISSRKLFFKINGEKFNLAYNLD